MSEERVQTEMENPLPKALSKSDVVVGSGRMI